MMLIMPAQLGSLALCKNVIRGVDNAKIDATIEQSTPRAHRITFNYYLGPSYSVPTGNLPLT